MMKDDSVLWSITVNPKYRSQADINIFLTPKITYIISPYLISITSSYRFNSSVPDGTEIKLRYIEILKGDDFILTLYNPEVLDVTSESKYNKAFVFNGVGLEYVDYEMIVHYTVECGAEKHDKQFRVKVNRREYHEGRTSIFGLLQSV